MGWDSCNMRKQKVGKEVKGRKSFVYSLKKHLLNTYVLGPMPGPGLLGLYQAGKETVKRELINCKRREWSIFKKSQ